MNKTDVSIIIPAYNEEKRITKCLERTLEYCLSQNWDFEIIVAEDGSKDNTVKIVLDVAQRDKRIKLLSAKNRLGKGGAIRNAILKAEKKFIGFMDADLSADPSEFQRLLSCINDYDVVIGSRMMRGSLPPIKRPMYRSLFSHLYSKFFRTLFRIPIYDPQCGFKLFKKEIVQKLFNEIKTTGFAFDSEVVVKAFSLGLKVKEIPIIWSHDAASKINVTHQIQAMGQDLLSIWYESHMLWLQNKTVYPQKKGSLIARLLFSVLSIYKKPRKEIQKN